MIDNIVAIKEASGSIPKISEIIENTTDEDFSVISGEDDLTFPVVALGGVGVISVVANVVPKTVSDMVEAALKGDMAAARKKHYELAPLTRALFTETNPIPVKRAMEMIGMPAGPLRAPLAPIMPENERILEEALKGIGCLK
jgi:4-hydroxy-tetrahydrodipicolinate synthase